MFGRQSSSKNLLPRVQSCLKDLSSRWKVTECGAVSDREHVTVVGEVLSTRIVPRGESFWYEVVINDGSGKINGWFFGRKKIAGLILGSIVLFDGLVQLDEGEMTIANPYYEFL